MRMDALRVQRARAHLQQVVKNPNTWLGGSLVFVLTVTTTLVWIYTSPPDDAMDYVARIHDNATGACAGTPL